MVLKVIIVSYCLEVCITVHHLDFTNMLKELKIQTNSKAKEGSKEDSTDLEQDEVW